MYVHVIICEISKLNKLNCGSFDLYLIQGLFVEGARWNRDKMCLDESLNGQLYDCMPLMLIEPTKRNEMQRDVTSLYEAPVYRTSSRQSITGKSGHSTNFVTFLDLKSDKQPTHWLFRGVALLCQLND